MALKRKVNGEWVSIAGPSTSSNNSKAVNVSLTDSAGLYDTSNVEGALAEIGYKVKDINTAVTIVDTNLQQAIYNIYGFTEDETGVPYNQNIKHAKKEFIKLSKYNLSQYLEEHPLLSTIKYEDGRYYDVTAEKQNLLLTNIVTYQIAQQTGLDCPLTWNDIDGECELWTFEQLLQLFMEIRNYVSPIISFQQYMEVNINKCTTIEQLNEVNIDFTEEAVEEYKSIYYKKIGVNNE